MRIKLALSFILSVSLLLGSIAGFGDGHWTPETNETESFTIGEEYTVFDRIEDTFFVSDWARSEFETALGYGLVPESMVLRDHTGFINRENFCALVMTMYNRLMGTPYKDNRTANPFSDTNSIDVKAAYELGIVSGTGDGGFSPYNSITRQEVAKMLASALVATGSVATYKLPDSDGVINKLADKDSVADWAAEYIAFMLSGGYMNGTSEDVFSPELVLSSEQAILVCGRMYAKNIKKDSAQLNRVNITSPANEGVFTSDNINVTWTRDKADDTSTYAVTATNAGQTSPTAVASEKKLSATLSPRYVSQGDALFVMVRSSDGACSMPMVVFKDEKPIRTAPPLKIKVTGYNAELSWAGADGAAEYIVIVSESRQKNSDTTGRGPDHEYRTTDKFMNITIEKPRYYVITVTAVGGDGTPLNYSERQEFHCGSYAYNNPADFWGDQPIKTEEDAKAQMIKLTVNVWKINKSGEKYASTLTVTINYRLEHRVWRAFQDIFEGPEKFPIKDVGGYAWRAPMSSGRLSEHNFGTGLDINSNENYCVYSNGTTVGSFWLPGENPYSITPCGDVMKAFERQGFTWGGDAWSNPQDYMHFSYLGT